MSQMSGPIATPAPMPLSLPRITAIVASALAILALLTASQTYLTMLSHGHSFLRLVLWQLGCWGFWAAAAPWMLRLSGHATIRRLVLTGIGLTIVHTLFTIGLTIAVQPFNPAISYDPAHAIGHLLFFALVDPLMVALLIVCGRGLASYQRNGQLELRESQLEAQLARAQLDALRLEIQPHFLFNTLNSLAALIRANDNPAALSMLLCLSDVMRDTLHRTDQQLAPLEQELQLIRKYVELQRTRFGSRLQVRYEVDRSAEQCDIPVLLLQPLVENALRHGIGPLPEGGHLVVGARIESGNVLRLWVSDDGVGPRPGFDLAKDANTGLTNTRARLERLYGTSAALTLSARAGGGTEVEVVMPAGSASVDRVAVGAA